MTTDPTDLGLTSAGTAYTPGTWFGIVGEHATVLLPPTEKARAGRIWALVDDGAGFDEVLDVLVSEGLRTLPGFVLVATSGGTVRVVVRGASVASFETADGPVEVEGSDSATWVERSLSGVTRMRVSLGASTSDEPEAAPLRLMGGLVRLAGLEVPPPAPEAPTAAGSAEAPGVPAASDAAASEAAAPAPPVEGDGAGTEQSPEGVERAFAPSLSVVPPMPVGRPEKPVESVEPVGSDEVDADEVDADEVDAEEPEEVAVPGEPAEPEEPRSVWGSAEPDEAAEEEADGQYTSDPLTDPMTDSFSFAKPLADGETTAPPGPAEAEEPEQAEQPEEPPAAGPSSPPPPPAFPPPGMPPAPPAPAAPPGPPPPPPAWSTPPAEPTDDHDGLTRAGAPMPDMGNRPGIPGQPAAPKVTAFPVARLEFSSGDRVDVDRVVLVGRAPEAGRFTQSEQPLLVTVPSPHQEISSTHCEVRPGTGVDHGAAVVTDLGSTNGTVLVQPGLGPEDLRPGVPVQLIPGAVIDLGDGLTIRVTHP